MLGACFPNHLLDDADAGPSFQRGPTMLSILNLDHSGMRAINKESCMLRETIWTSHQQMRHISKKRADLGLQETRNACAS